MHNVYKYRQDRLVELHKQEAYNNGFGIGFLMGCATGVVLTIIAAIGMLI